MLRDITNFGQSKNQTIIEVKRKPKVKQLGEVKTEIRVEEQKDAPASRPKGGGIVKGKNSTRRPRKVSAKEEEKRKQLEDISASMQAYYRKVDAEELIVEVESPEPAKSEELGPGTSQQARSLISAPQCRYNGAVTAVGQSSHPHSNEEPLTCKESCNEMTKNDLGILLAASAPSVERSFPASSSSQCIKLANIPAAAGCNSLLTNTLAAAQRMAAADHTPALPACSSAEPSSTEMYDSSVIPYNSALAASPSIFQPSPCTPTEPTASQHHRNPVTIPSIWPSKDAIQHSRAPKTSVGVLKSNKVVAPPSEMTTTGQQSEMPFSHQDSKAKSPMQVEATLPASFSTPTAACHAPTASMACLHASPATATTAAATRHSAASVVPVHTTPPAACMHASLTATMTATMTATDTATSMLRAPTTSPATCMHASPATATPAAGSRHSAASMLPVQTGSPAACMRASSAATRTAKDTATSMLPVQTGSPAACMRASLAATRTAKDTATSMLRAPTASPATCMHASPATSTPAAGSRRATTSLPDALPALCLHASPATRSPNGSAPSTAHHSIASHRRRCRRDLGDSTELPHLSSTSCHSSMLEHGSVNLTATPATLPPLSSEPGTLHERTMSHQRCSGNHADAIQTTRARRPGEDAAGVLPISILSKPAASHVGNTQQMRTGNPPWHSDNLDGSWDSESAQRSGEEVCSSCTTQPAPPTLGPGEEVCSSCTTQPAPPTLGPLQRLLALCKQDPSPQRLPSMDKLMANLFKRKQIRKHGEGSYGEVYCCGAVVIKVVPIRAVEGVDPNDSESAPDTTSAADMAAEAVRALTMTGLRNQTANTSSSYIETSGFWVCKGPYAKSLCRAWHTWDQDRESENKCVADFPADTLYAVLVMADGGAALEDFEVQSYEQGVSILLQVTAALAVGEASCQFEHRDLHWGNVLVSKTATKLVQFTLGGRQRSIESCGVAATLIDFTASRLVLPGGDAVFNDLEKDPEVFAGPQGECQFDTYREMRKGLGGCWDGYHPWTNCLWIHYLAHTMLSKKLVNGVLDRSQRKLLNEFRVCAQREADARQPAAKLLQHAIFQPLLC